MLNFVRVLAFAELVAGVIWLWPAVFPHEPSVDELGAQFRRGDYTVPDDAPVSPLPGLALLCSGTVSLAVVTRTTCAQPPSV